jgi:hypothetical protein
MPRTWNVTTSNPAWVGGVLLPKMLHWRGTLSRRSVRMVRRSLISHARKLRRSCWRRRPKVQRSLFRKVSSSWTPDIHSRSTIQSRCQQHLRKPGYGMRGDTPFG